MNMRKIVGLFLIILLLLPVAASENEVSSLSDQQTKRYKVSSCISILIARPENMSSVQQAESAWLKAFIQSYLEFRLGAVNNLCPSDLNSVTALIPEYNLYGKAISKEKYDRAAEALAADYTVYSVYNIEDKNQNFLLRIDFIPKGSSKPISTFEQNSKTLDKIPNLLDSAVINFIDKIGIAVESYTVQFFQTPVIASLRYARELSEKIIEHQNKQNLADYCVKVASKAPNNYLAYYVGAKAFESLSQFENAAVLLNELIQQLGPVYPKLYPFAGSCFRKCERLEDALKVVTVAEKLKFDSPQLELEKAMILEALDEDAKAETAYRSVLSKDPSNYQALLYFVKKAKYEKYRSEAAALAEQLAINYPRDGLAQLEAGRALLLVQKFDLARKALLEAAQLLSNNTEANILLGDVAMQSGDPNSASTYYEFALQKMQDNPELYLKLAKVYLQLGSSNKAYALMKSVETKFYANMAIVRMLGISAKSSGDIETAKKALNKVVQSNQADAEALVALADIHYSENDDDAALQLYKQAQSLAASDRYIAERISLLSSRTSTKDKITPTPLQQESSAAPEVASWVGAISGGSIFIGALSAGIMFNTKIANIQPRYRLSKNTDEVNSLHDKMEKNKTYRDLSYVLSGISAALCAVSVVFIIK